MSEKIPNQTPNPYEQVVESQMAIIGIAASLEEAGTVLKFPGISPAAYEKLKKDDEDLPGFVTPVDELIKRMEEEGVKVFVGKDPRNMFVLPASSDDKDRDSLFISHLSPDGNTNDNAFRALLKAMPHWDSLPFEPPAKSE